MIFSRCTVFSVLLLATTAVPSLAQVVQPPVQPKPWPGRYPFVQADIDFITGMISHHAQAIVMANWAPTHGASKPVLILCERIINAQNDEITLMQNWLRDRNQPVPDPSPKGMKMTMGGVEHMMLMPGMLSDEQMSELDKARGADFDHLFLRYMIQHHQGALAMVNQLFAADGAGQDEAIYKFASDVYADQSTEVERMQKMYLTLSWK